MASGPSVGAKGAAQLALLGGPKAVTRTRPPWPLIDARVARAVTQALRRESLSPLVGGVPGQFEEAFAKYHGRKFGLMVNGGTAALHLGLVGCGVQPGDEVITSPYSWGATTGCILHQNAIPVFADIDPETLCLDPKKIEDRISDRTKAIVVVHIYGMPCDMGPILRVARAHGLRVVEDCAQATGARYTGRLVGTLGDVGAFSLQASKNLTGGEGGILIANDRLIYERALAFGAHPARLSNELKDEELRTYIDSLGFNFRPHPLAAAMAMAQLPHLAGWIRNKERNFARLFRRVAGIAELHGAEFLRRHKGSVHGYHMAPLKVVHPELRGLPRSVIVDALRAEGVPVGGYVGTPIPLRPRFRDLVFYGRGCPWTCRHAVRLPDYAAGNWPVAERVCREGEIILMGNHYALDLKLMDQYATAIEKLASNLDALRARAGLRK
jgi:dTDP-4-amino-4,6-dideoxygalactose transaminase